MRRFDNQALAKSENEKFNFRDLGKAYWSILGTYRKTWLFFFSMLFIISFYSLVPPFIIGKIVDLFSFTVSPELSRQYILYASILGISYVVVSYMRLSLKNRISNIQSEVTYKTKVEGFEKLLSFSYGWHIHENAGAKAQRIKNGIESYKTLNGKLTNEIIRIITAMIGITIVFLFLKPLYVLFFVFYAVVFWTILLTFQKKIQTTNYSYYRSVENAGGSYIEGLSNILTIKTLGAGSSFSSHIADKELMTKEYEYTIRKIHNRLWKIFQAFNGICYGVFLTFIGFDVVSGAVTAGALVIFYGYLHNLMNYSGDMIETYETVLDAKSGIGRMMGILGAKPILQGGDKPFPYDWKNIRITDASFAYQLEQDKKNTSGHPQTVQGISIEINKGEKIGIVGKTGSGKSTLAKLLTGLYTLDGGEYMIGKTPFHDIIADEISSELTLILQETEIFNFTLHDNITMMKHITLEDLNKAIHIAALDEVVEKLPNGLDTIVGEKGYHLSGGERQRVGIARALCKNASILILDEATSSLDSKTERSIQSRLDEELKEKTIISIAHRVSTLENTDRIYVFEKGEIVEMGTYKELSNNLKSKFFELYSVQEKST